MNRSSPIGIFDSGLGGLSVASKLKSLLPNEDLLYLADNRRLPYGDLYPEEISQCVSEAIKFLEKKGAKLIVLACHTASAHWIRGKTNVPVIGMVESSIRSLEIKPKEMVGIFGTTGTVRSGVYQYELECRYGDLKPKGISFPRLVRMIESNWLHNTEMEAHIRDEIGSESFEVVLLACTHYPLIFKSFQKVLGQSVRLVDPSTQMAMDLKAFLEKKDLINPVEGSKQTVFVTESPDLFSKVGSRFFGQPIHSSLSMI